MNIRLAFAVGLIVGALATAAPAAAPQGPVLGVLLEFNHGTLVGSDIVGQSNDTQACHMRNVAYEHQHRFAANVLPYGVCIDTAPFGELLKHAPPPARYHWGAPAPRQDT